MVQVEAARSAAGRGGAAHRYADSGDVANNLTAQQMRHFHVANAQNYKPQLRTFTDPGPLTPTTGPASIDLGPAVKVRVALMAVRVWQWVLLPWAAAAVVLLVAPALAAPKHREHRTILGVTWQRIHSAKDGCTRNAKAGEKVSVHWKAQTPGGNPLEDTYVVGRPHDITLLVADDGDEDAVVARLRQTGGSPIALAMIDMCIGEVRRVGVPAKAWETLPGERPRSAPDDGSKIWFDVELLKIHDTDDDSERHDDDAGQQQVSSSTICELCRAMVEEFYLQWVGVMTQQLNEKRVKPEGRSGDGMPGIMYNDDVEAMVQKFCDSKAMGSPKYVSELRTTCRDIFKLHKRAIVGEFLSQPMEGRHMPARVSKICGPTMAAACNNGDTPSATSPDDVAMVLRLGGHARGNSHNSVLPKHVREAVESSCQKAMFRYSKASVVQETCDDLATDVMPDIVEAFTQRVNDDNAALTARKVCVEAAGLCSRSQLSSQLPMTVRNEL
eukprot:jgi/Chlat1/3357/Chrsp23S03781